jgi:hypothetical protein
MYILQPVPAYSSKKDIRIEILFNVQPCAHHPCVYSTYRQHQGTQQLSHPLVKQRFLFTAGNIVTKAYLYNIVQQSSNQTYETANQVATPCGLAKEPIKLTHNSNTRIHHSLLSKLQLTFIQSSASFPDVFHMQHAFILDLKCSPCSECCMLSSR